jgi:hypothetical protein
MRMQDFYREIDDNININRTFSIKDIGEQDKLTRFFIIGEDTEIGNILEDLDFIPPVDPSFNSLPTTEEEDVVENIKIDESKEAE